MPGDKRLVTENFLSSNFNYKVNYNLENTLYKDCDQITSRYYVNVDGITSTGLRLPSQDQLFPYSNALPIIYLYMDHSVTADGFTVNGYIPPVGSPFAGDPSITEFGFVYGPNSYPVIGGPGVTKIIGSNVTISGGNILFTNTVTGLPESTLYFVRVYAINNIGTSYATVPIIVDIGYDWFNIMISTRNWGRPIYTHNYVVGETKEGGVIVKVYYETGIPWVDKLPFGLVRAAQNLGSHVWGCNFFCNSEYAYYGSGMGNTVEILNRCSEPNTAARVCADYTANSKSDWFLPSEHELNDMCFYGGVYPNAIYWSSTEYKQGFNYSQAFGRSTTVSSNSESKGATHIVHPCRYIESSWYDAVGIDIYVYIPG